MSLSIPLMEAAEAFGLDRGLCCKQPRHRRRDRASAPLRV